MNKGLFTVVIPNYNGRLLLEKNLPYVVKAWKNDGNNISEVIIVDDASFDDSTSFIRKNYPDIRLFKNAKNKGFSGTVNLGVKYCKSKYVVLLNSDVIPSENFLEEFELNFDDEKVFAVSLHETGYGWARGEFRNGYLHHEQGKESDVVHETFWVSGGSGVFRKKHWDMLHGMDERLFSPFYWEDIDLCYRAAKRGLKNLWDPKKTVEHKHESTISKLSKKYVNRIRERNELLFIWKNITSRNLMRKHISALFKRAMKHPGYLLIIFMGLGKIRPLLKARKREIKEVTVSDEILLSRFQYD